MIKPYNPSDTIYIYTLSCPKTGDVRYVGVTKNPQKRLTDHIYESKRGAKSHRGYWIRSLINEDLKPIMTVIDKTDLDNWVQCEMTWIAYYKRLGCNLVNSTDGGEGIMNPSEETRRKLSESSRGRVASEETRRKLSIINTGQNSHRYGKKHSNETRRKQSEASKGKPKSEQHRRNVFEASPFKKLIFQYDKLGHFIRSWDSIRQAEKSLGIFRTHIIDCCKHRAKSAGGYIWRYADDPLPSNELTQKSFNFDE